MNRRNVLAWIAGGVVVAGASVATGAFLYRSVSHAQAGQSVGLPVRATLTGHQGAITALAWSSDGTQLASGSKDRTIRVWPISEPSVPLVIHPQILGITALAWNPQQDQLAASGLAGDVVLYAIGDASRQATDEQVVSLTGTVSSLAWNSAGSLLYAGTLHDGLRVVTAANGQVQQVGSSKATIRCMALAANGSNGQLLAFGTQLGMVAALDLSTQKWVFRQRLHTGAVTALAWSPDGTRLASGGADELLQIVDAGNWQVQASVQQGSAINGIAWKPGETRVLVTALDNAAICLYDVAVSSARVYQAHSGPVTTLTWGQGGLATGSSDKSVIIWDL